MGGNGDASNVLMFPLAHKLATIWYSVIVVCHNMNGVVQGQIVKPTQDTPNKSMHRSLRSVTFHDVSPGRRSNLLQLLRQVWPHLLEPSRHFLAVAPKRLQRLNPPHHRLRINAVDLTGPEPSHLALGLVQAVQEGGGPGMGLNG
jgi:hypothetical protein